MTLRRIVRAVCAWWRSRSIERAIPEIGRINREIEEARRHHRPVRHLHARKSDVMHRALAGHSDRSPA